MLGQGKNRLKLAWQFCQISPILNTKYLTNIYPRLTNTYIIIPYLTDPLLVLNWYQLDSLNQINIYQYLTVTYEYLVCADIVKATFN